MLNVFEDTWNPFSKFLYVLMACFRCGFNEPEKYQYLSYKNKSQDRLLHNLLRSSSSLPPTNIIIITKWKPHFFLFMYSLKLWTSRCHARSYLFEKINSLLQCYPCLLTSWSGSRITRKSDIIFILQNKTIKQAPSVISSSHIYNNCFISTIKLC